MSMKKKFLLYLSSLSMKADMLNVEIPIISAVTQNNNIF